MFDASNSSLILSSSPPSSSAFNRQYHNSRYHPYNRISSSSSSPSYYRTNEFEKSCSFDHNDQNSIIQNYDHSAMFCDYNFTWTATPSSPLPVSCSSLDREMNLERQTVFGSNCEGTGAPYYFKRRVSANKKERRRTQSINTAFSDLRTAIPNVQPDTKLSKIKTLKLATKYIEFLMDILARDDPIAMPNAFKAEITKTRKDHRDLMKYDNSLMARKIKGRTGWPQTVWQSELNRNENFHHHHCSMNETVVFSPSDSSSILLGTTSNRLPNSPVRSHTYSLSSNTKVTNIQACDKSHSVNHNENKM